MSLLVVIVLPVCTELKFAVSIATLGSIGVALTKRIVLAADLAASSPERRLAFGPVNAPDGTTPATSGAQPRGASILLLAARAPGVSGSSTLVRPFGVRWPVSSSLSSW